MKTTWNTSRRSVKTLLMGLAVAAVIGGASAGPALADEWHGGHDRFEHQTQWRDHYDRRDYGWRGHEGYERGYSYGAPAYRYAPRSYYYAPPAYYYAPWR